MDLVILSHNFDIIYVFSEAEILDKLCCIIRVILI